MSRIVDNLIAFRILQKLVRPFKDTDAYRLGIIDDKGKNLVKSNTFTTSDQRDAYTYLDRLVFNVKKLINRLPGGESKMKNLVAALWLIKEYYEKNDRSTSLMAERYTRILEKIDDGVVLVEEEITVKKFLQSLEEDGAVGGVANVTGAAVSTDQPKIDKKNIKKYQMMARRKPINVGA
jgi:hypothetical protein